MIGDPPTWLVFTGVVGAMVAGVFIGDAVRREFRAMLAEDNRPPKRSDQPSRDGPAPWGDVIEVPHDARRASR